ncbi:F420-dependent glucose-6-phosphate dehydrogenase [Arthrobacter sp. Hiyo8]|nr:F420-dependent glucose-6-phosphate dehydrogenase [Arthrobacter sp. Hiyo8]
MTQAVKRGCTETISASMIFRLPDYVLVDKHTTCLRIQAGEFRSRTTVAIRKFHELLHPAFTNHDRPVSSGDAYRAPLWRELHLRQAFDACDVAPLTSATRRVTSCHCQKNPQVPAHILRSAVSAPEGSHARHLTSLTQTWIPHYRPVRSSGSRLGHESTLQIIELGEGLGFDSAWLRHRHLQFGISSPIAMMAAASQRTSRIELGTAVTPLGWENPLRLAEDLATVDLLAGGRINPGLSVGEPMHYDTLKHELYPDSSELEDFSYGRLNRFAG